MMITERRLHEAAIAGNTTCLLELLQEDSLILDRVMMSRVDETPLHISAMLGHLDFAREILSRKPELTRELNSQGFSPLHLASAKGHLEMVKELLKADLDACMLRGPDGGTALHEAGSKGRVGVIKELIGAKPELAHALTCRGETVLHVCVTHNQIEASKLLLEMVVDKEILKWKDQNGNTVLHLAVAKRQIQMVKLLLTSAAVEVNAVNTIGLTALDVLIQGPTQLADMEIGEILRGAGAMRTSYTSQSIGYSIPSANNLQTDASLPPTRSDPCQNSVFKSEMKKKRLGKRGNTLMVVAVLIATVTFEAGLNPPGGDCAKLNANCTIQREMHYGMNNTLTYTVAVNYNGFILVDTIGFLSSLSIIVLIISGLPFRRRCLMWVLVVLMMISLCSMAVLFSIWLNIIKPDAIFMTIFPILFWLGLNALLFLWQLVRFVLWLLRKCGVIGKTKRRGLSRQSDGDV